MKFSEKLMKLRKANGYSQEEVANRLNVSRQAVSKWENDQGFPEMEKLLEIGNLFQVSMDYLLKEEPTNMENDQNGFYVSRELASAYVSRERKQAQAVSIAVFCFVISGLPVLLVPRLEDVMSVFSFAFVVVGILILVLLGFQKDPYEHLERTPLIFDFKVLQDIKKESETSHHRCVWMIVLGIIAIAFNCLLAIVVDDVLQYEGSFPVDALYLLLFACSILLFIYAGMMMSTYEMLTNNEKYLTEKKKSSLYLYTISIAVLIYIALGMYYGKEAFKIFWVIIPIVALLTALYEQVRRRF